DHNWLPGAAHPGFEATLEGLKVGEGVKLQTANAEHLISCQVGIASKSEYTGTKSLKETLDLIGCTLVATNQQCNSFADAPEKEGEIEFSATGTLGFVKIAKKRLAGWDLAGIETHILCGTAP